MEDKRVLMCTILYVDVHVRVCVNMCISVVGFGQHPPKFIGGSTDLHPKLWSQEPLPGVS